MRLRRYSASLSEVEGRKSIPAGALEDRSVPGVFAQVSRPNHVMPVRFQFSFCLGTNAGVQKIM